MWKKLQSRSGETMTEVLVASLVVVLGVLLFAMMVNSSFRIITKSEDRVKEIYAAESRAEEAVSIVSSDTVTIGASAYAGFMKPGDFTGSVSVNVYGSEDIKAYKK